MKKTTKVSITAAIISFSLVIVHFINKITFFLTTLKELLFSDNSSLYNWRFGKIYFTKKGKGKPILLVHDLTGASSHYEWKELVGTLSKTYTVYTIDLIGCGRSDKPKMTYTNYLYVQLLTDFIKNVIKEPTTIVATGRSSSIAIMSCYIDPQLYTDIILINPTDLKDLNKYPRRQNKVLKWILDIPLLGTLIYNIVFSKSNIYNKFKTEYLYNPNKPLKNVVNAYSEAAHLGGSSSKYVYTSIRCHYTNTNIIHALKDIDVSIFIIGGKEVYNIEEIIHGYQYYNASIEYGLIDETKHLPQFEKPEEVLQLIDIYLNKK